MFHVKHFLLFLMVLMVFNDFKLRPDTDMDRTGGRAQTMVFILWACFTP